MRERGRTSAENSRERKKMNSTTAHESGLPDFLTGKPVIGQKPSKRNRSAGFEIRLTGYEPESNMREFGLPVSLTGWPVSKQNGNFTQSAFWIVLNRKSGFVPAKHAREFSFPVLITGRQVTRQ